MRLLPSRILHDERPIDRLATIQRMFTVAQRDALRGRVIALAEEDERVVAAAAVGSLAVDGGDRLSDVDMTFGVDDRLRIVDVLDDWTRTLADEFDAVPLVDLERGPTIYRVFLLQDLLQLDLSMTPARSFRPAGPRFRLLFGETAPELHADVPTDAGSLFIATPAIAQDIFGWGAIYALHARVCIERGRRWQAEHYVGAVRDHALALACRREDLPAAQARSYDDLSAETLGRLDDGHVGSLEPTALRAALAACMLALTYEGAQARLPHAEIVAERLAELR
jgi:hypothetical protein